MPIKTLESSQARNHWREMLDMVLVGDTDVVITRYNKPMVTLLAYEDYLDIQHELARQHAVRKVMRQVTADSPATMLATEGLLAQE